MITRLVLSVYCLLMIPALLRAEVPHLIRYQGQAMDTHGVPLEGPHTLVFRLYDAETAGASLWQEQQANVPLTQGRFSVLLGSLTPLQDMDWSKPCWLSVQINQEEELSPRQRITSVPMAIRAEQANQLTVPIATSTITDDANRLIPSGAIILWIGANCPPSYTRANLLDGKFLVAGETFNATAGGRHTKSLETSSTGSHTHALSGTTSPASGVSCGWNASKGCGGGNPSDAPEFHHTHSAGSLTANATGTHTHLVEFDNRPEFATVLLCQKD